jgi:hypothetical protein
LLTFFLAFIFILPSFVSFLSFCTSFLPSFRHPFLIFLCTLSLFSLPTFQPLFFSRYFFFLSRLSIHLCYAFIGTGIGSISINAKCRRCVASGGLELRVSNSERDVTVCFAISCWLTLCCQWKLNVGMENRKDKHPCEKEMTTSDFFL